MISRPALSRRALAALLARFSVWPLTVTVAAAQVSDRGIGGTGVAGGPENEPGDRGIGGTGVIGTLRAFGSVVVNGLRVAYADDVPVTLDDQPAQAADLKIGQVLRVDAARRRHGYVARSIAVVSEVVGPVDTIGPDGLVVMGQEVTAPPGTAPALEPGDRVSVYGLRRTDGRIVASLIERRPDAPLRVVGPVRADDLGRLTIGGLVLSRLDPAFVGVRCAAVGTYENGVFTVASARSEQRRIADTQPSHLVVEAYVSRSSAGLQLGSGLLVMMSAGSTLPAYEHNAPAILDVHVSASGQLAVRSMRPDPGGLGNVRGERAGMQASPRESHGSRDDHGPTQDGDRAGRRGGAGLGEGPGSPGGPNGAGHGGRP